MIGGTILGDEARVELKVHGIRGKSKTIEAVVDTGFSSWLTLPPDLIRWLGLPWCSVEQGVLADGSTCRYDVFEAAVARDGKLRPLFVDSADIEPLIGMKLMRGYELKIDIRDGGKVRLKRLTR